MQHVLAAAPGDEGRLPAPASPAAGQGPRAGITPPAREAQARPAKAEGDGRLSPHVWRILSNLGISCGCRRSPLVTDGGFRANQESQSRGSAAAGGPRSPLRAMASQPGGAFPSRPRRERRRCGAEAAAAAVPRGAAGAGPSPEGRTGGKKERGRTSLTGRRGRRRGGGRRHGGSSQQKRPGARHSRREPASLAAPSSSSLRPTPQRGCYGHSARWPRARRPSGRAAAGKWRAGRERRRVPAGGGGEGAAMAPRRVRGERGAGAAEPALPSVREGCPAYGEAGCTPRSCGTAARGRLQRMRGRVAGQGWRGETCVAGWCFLAPF